jgi:DNA-binding transcriptional LysR family regulator
MDRLGAMETFVYVVETGSFSAAARRLNIGQPAVSKTIAQLESRLAVRLLLRSTRGLTPTEAGLAFFEPAKRAIEEADEADNAARGSASGLSGNLRACHLRPAAHRSAPGALPNGCPRRNWPTIRSGK